MTTRADMLTHIDAKAGTVRSKYITISPGQEATYILKAQQAREYLAAGYTGTVGGLIQAEMAATGETARDSCDRILAEEAAWANLAAMIEGIRRTAKVQIASAETDEIAEAVTQAALAQFNQLL